MKKEDNEDIVREKKKGPARKIGEVKYSEVDKRTARELYYLFGPGRSYEKVAKLLDINVNSIKQWASNDGWSEYIEERSKTDESLALAGKFNTEILAKNTKAKVVLEMILEKFMEKLLGPNGQFVSIQSSDALNAAKALLGLMENDKNADVAIKGNAVQFIKNDE